MKKRIGYKASNNFKCETLTYEIGKTYEINNIDICDHGFHYCPKIGDVLRYYTVDKDLKILEIEDIGDERIKDDVKICTNRIKIIREVPIKEHKLFKLNKNGNVIYLKRSDNSEEWYKYNKSNKLIHCKNSDGFQEWRKYDENNNLIYYKNSRGYEEWYKYDKNNNKIYSEDSNEYKEWKEYDEKGNLIHYKNSNEREYWKKYDKNNNLIHYKDSSKFEEWHKYDKQGNLTYYKNSDGNKEWKEYNKNNQLVYYKSSDGFKKWKKYDEKGNITYVKDSRGYKYWWEYDKKGNLIAYKDNIDKNWKITISKTETLEESKKMNIRKDRLDPYGHLVVIKLKNTNQYGILKDKTYSAKETSPYILYTVLLYLGGSYEKEILHATEFDVVKIYDYNDIYISERM